MGEPSYHMGHPFMNDTSAEATSRSTFTTESMDCIIVGLSQCHLFSNVAFIDASLWSSAVEGI